MTEETKTPPPEKKSGEIVLDALVELLNTIVAFVKAPRALWGINIPYVIEGLTYFGILTILGKFCSENCALTDVQAGWVYGGVTGGITFAMLIFGGLADKIGVRVSLFIALTAMAIGRCIVAGSDTFSLTDGMWSPQFFVMCGGLLLMVTAYGLYQPAAYAGVKRYTNPQTAAMGYAVVYALMNLGAFFSGYISPLTRRHFEDVLPPNGLASVFWLYALLTLSGALATIFIITRRTDKNAVDQVKAEADKMAEKEGAKDGSDGEKKEEEKPKTDIEVEMEKPNNLSFLVLLALTLASFVLFVAHKAGGISLPNSSISLDVINWKFELASALTLVPTILFGIGATWAFLSQRPDHPFRDKRFVFFIFILIPVQTLFAHNWLTLPYYLDRAFAGTGVSENFEFFSNLNPILIFVLAPIVAGLTARANTYKMMIYGTLVMAAPTFLLTFGTSVPLFLTYILLMSIGEAMWQPRFLQWIAEIAPEGKTGAYMGIGQLPWFLTKVVTSFYSGWFVANYIPKPDVNEATGEITVLATNTGEMWLIYALIAMISPIALIVAKGWMKKGMARKAS